MTDNGQVCLGKGEWGPSPYVPKTAYMPICKEIMIRNTEGGVEVMVLEDDLRTFVVPWRYVGQMAEAFAFLEYEREVGR